MNNEQYLLGKLAEEAAELAQIAVKAQQFGLKEVFGGQEGTPLNNAQRIELEYNDVMGVINMLNGEVNAGILQRVGLQQKKAEKVTKWRDYARTLGTVE